MESPRNYRVKKYLGGFVKNSKNMSADDFFMIMLFLMVLGILISFKVSDYFEKKEREEIEQQIKNCSVLIKINKKDTVEVSLIRAGIGVNLNNLDEPREFNDSIHSRGYRFATVQEAESLLIKNPVL